MDSVVAIPNFLFKEGIIETLSDVLREHDDTFISLEGKYLKNTDLLRKIGGLDKPDFVTYIEAEKQAVQISFLNAAYLGFRANLENFRSPVGCPFLDQSDFLKEHLIGHSNMCRNADRIKTQFRCSLPLEAEQYYDAVNEYFIMLDAVGTKLAHYWGYQFANKLLLLVEPGYCPDIAQTIRYGHMLEKYLGFYPPELDPTNPSAEIEGSVA